MISWVPSCSNIMTFYNTVLASKIKQLNRKRMHSFSFPLNACYGSLRIDNQLLAPSYPFNLVVLQQDSFLQELARNEVVGPETHFISL